MNTSDARPVTRRPLTVAMGVFLLLGALIAAAAVAPVPRWELWLVGVLALLGASLGLLLVALMPREISSSAPPADPPSGD